MTEAAFYHPVTPLRCKLIRYAKNLKEGRKSYSGTADRGNYDHICIDKRQRPRTINPKKLLRKKKGKFCISFVMFSAQWLSKFWNSWWSEYWKNLVFTRNSSSYSQFMGWSRQRSSRTSPEQAVGSSSVRWCIFNLSTSYCIAFKNMFAQWENFVQVCEWILFRSSFHPDVICYNLLIDAYGQKKKFSSMRSATRASAFIPPWWMRLRE